MWCLAVCEQSSLAYNAHMHATADTPSTTLHTAFHNPLHTTNKHTKHICVRVGKMALDVGMV